MKLRISGNSIRLRLTRSEVERFGSEGTVEESVNFGDGNGSGFRYLIKKTSRETLHASFDGARIVVSVPSDIAGKWIATEDVGIEGVDGELQIFIEKDFVCLNPRKSEDQSDNFPHPDPNAAC
ncbi:MAG: hypothetical protein KDB79_15230 [Acidobacteria bacterium]|nr:hypothetical protein [Acidobacteriota bacterium]